MTLHLVKLCVGVSAIDELVRWQAVKRNTRVHGGARVAFHRTFQSPTRRDELLAGGSLYWVIKGTILVRQKIVGFSEGQKKDGTPCCLILLDRKLVPVRPQPRRAFQGWRYLSDEDAPEDLKRGARQDIATMPASMRKTLADLGLI